MSTISVTFVGCSALLLVFRETIGGKMTRYDSHFTLSFMQAGFIVTAGNAVGRPVAPNLAPFALALTVMLFTTGFAYLVARARALPGSGHRS